MAWRKGFAIVRFLAGFLLAPAIVTVSVSVSLDSVRAHLGTHPDGPAKIIQACFFGVVGLGLPYFLAFFFGLPYVLVLCDRGKLSFHSVAIPTLVLAVAYPLVVYWSSLDTSFRSHAIAIAAPQSPAVLASGLFFYFVSIWKSVRVAHE